jgi:Fe-S-cluster containining protein
VAPTIHYLFPDHAFGYSCSTCDGRCCGADAVVLHIDLDRKILDRHPELLPFARPGVTEKLRVLEMPKPRCYFNRADHRCEIQVNEGYRAKPAMCRIFPVSLLWRMPDRDEIFAGLEMRHCPIFLTHDRVPDTALDHAGLHAQIGEAIETGEFVPYNAPAHMARYPRWFLAQESRWVARYAEDRSRPFGDLLARQLASALSDAPVEHDPSAAVLADARPRLAAHLAPVAALFGIEHAPELDAATNQNLVALSPMLRMNWFMDGADEDYQARAIRIPFVFATLAMFAAVQSAATTAVGVRPPDRTLQAIDGLHNALGAVAMLTTYLDGAAIPGPGHEHVTWPDYLAPHVRGLVNVGPDGKSTLLRSLRERIEELELPPGDRLLPVRLLAKHRGTVRFVEVG